MRRAVVSLVSSWSFCSSAATASSRAVGFSAEPNPPAWPASVTVFKPTDSTADVETRVNAIYAENGGRQNHGQFSSSRFAVLFMPGTYQVDVPVGFYTQVLGLGASPSDVVFTGEKGVFCEEGDYNFTVGALDTFWRGAENFETQANHLWTDTTGMLWAVSQAAPLRRIVVKENLKLYQYYQPPDRAAGYASGGFMADSVVHGNVVSGSQQQWLTRNSQVGGWPQGVWNMVFVGVDGAPPAHCGVDPKMCTKPMVVVPRTPLAASKPFITANPTTGKFSLIVPAPSRNTSGAPSATQTSEAVDFSSVYVANNATDTASTINAKLSVGLHVVLAPGVYRLDAPLTLAKKGQVLLGLGFATLIPTNGTAAVKVPAGVTGARVAGLLLQAGTTNSPTLLQWGDADHREKAVLDEDYGFIHDVFVRVGGPALPVGQQARTDVMVQIDGSSVVADNIWLWRADHVEGGGLVKNGDNPCDHALVVNGDDVTIYGLAAEHALKDIVLWTGNEGATYFFQSELPYDVKEYPYAGYNVAFNVTSHQSYGAGVYHYFRDYAVTVASGIVCPKIIEASFYSPLSVFLNGMGTMLHVMNDKGDATQKPSGPGADPTWLCDNDAAQGFKAIDHIFSVGNFGAPNGTCKIGDSVPCPGGGANCAGNECCPGGITCPSADPLFACCPVPKTVNCLKPGPGPSPTQPPSPSPKIPPAPGPHKPPTPAPKRPQPSPAPTTAHCTIGQAVKCPHTSTECAGSQCCPDGSVCPSAPDTFHGCQHPKEEDCTKSWMS